MQSRPLNFLVSLMLLGLLTGCNKEEIGTEVNDHFFLENDGAVMPVFVRGNTRSKILVIYLHGGPGGSSLEAYQDHDNPFKRLQSDYGVVYWDQRCAGASQGECGDLTLSTYTDDLAKLIILLKNRYASDLKIFLVGHSWGGSLGINYLATGNNQSNIRGWIEVGGGHNVPRIVKLEREMLLEVGNRQIAGGNNSAEWQRAINNATNLDFRNIDDLYRMNSLAVEAESLMRKADSVNAKTTNSWFYDSFLSPMERASANNNLNASFAGMKNELASLDLSNKLSLITTPTLMIWGKYDFRVPPEFAYEEFYEYSAVEKKLVIFERSAHFVQWNEPDEFFRVIREFIEKYRQ